MVGEEIIEILSDRLIFLNVSGVNENFCETESGTYRVEVSGRGFSEDANDTSAEQWRIRIWKETEGAKSPTGSLKQWKRLLRTKLTVPQPNLLPIAAPSIGGSLFVSQSPHHEVLPSLKTARTRNSSFSIRRSET